MQCAGSNKIFLTVLALSWHKRETWPHRFSNKRLFDDSTPRPSRKRLKNCTGSGN